MNWRKYKYIGLGCLTYVPGLHAWLRRGTGGTGSARYCYSVWLRHLVLNRRLENVRSMRSVAELGPGDSLGIGMSALLSGAERYVAMDALPHAKGATNLQVFDQLVELFKLRTPIPDDEEFPGVQPKLDDYSFPSGLLTDEVLETSLAPERLQGLRQDIEQLDRSVKYLPTWYEQTPVSEQSVDLIISQAVLEHVDSLRQTYDAMYRWLSPGGIMSHQIDFKSHETAPVWNGHLAYSDFVWSLMRGRLPYFINRHSPSEHLDAANLAGFKQVSLRRVIREDGLDRSRLAPRFRDLPDQDVKSSGAFLQAVRPEA